MELIASLPPRKITLFPVLKQRPNASAVTLGLDSYIIPITPKGTLFLPIRRPFGRGFILITSPTGSSRLIICLIPSAIPCILSFVSLNLSTRDSFMLAAIAFLISVSFAKSIRSIFFSSVRASHTAISPSFFELIPRPAIR